MEPRIFISYRREDAAGDAGRLADHLYRRFGANRVFLDIDAINPGIDFVKALHTSLGETAAILVVIGPRWTSLRNADGTRRLDDDKDFVRLEVEAALGRSIPVVPVLVQGAAMPKAEELPAALAALATRQAAVLDHAEFHDDVERLCDRLARMIGVEAPVAPSPIRRWWPAIAAVGALIVGAGAYVSLRGPVDDASGTRGSSSGAAATDGGLSADRAREVESLLAEAAAQGRRGQLLESLGTLARARQVAPDSAPVQRAQEDVAMDWIRNVRVESGKSSFAEAVEPALSVIDAALPTATGQRRADLLAHSGWATFLIWRDGNRELKPDEWYREAIALDPGNPYANSMLAHWTLFQSDDVAAAVQLFATAVGSGRELEAVRALQWAAYGNASGDGVNAERVRLADAMRRDGETLNARQAQALYAPYYFALSASRRQERQELLAAISPDDHIGLLEWAFRDYAANDESRRRLLRFYSAVLQARAGRVPRATNELRALEQELANAPGSLLDAVQAALKQFGNGGRGRQGG